MSDRASRFPRIDTKDDDFVVQVYRYLDETMSEEEFAAFSALLESDAARRRQFMSVCLQNEMASELRADHRHASTDLDPQTDEEALMNLNALLEVEAKAPMKLNEARSRSDEPAPLVDSEHPLIARYLKQLQQASEPPVRHYVIPRWLVYSGVAAVIALGIVLFWPKAEPLAPQPTIVQTPEKRVVGELLDQLDAKWEGASERLASGAPIYDEPLQLLEGMARIRFANGAEVILEAPVSFHPLATDQVRLTGGKLVGLCATEESRGFSVIAPNAHVLDLGTEFALFVADSGETQAHVYDGEIALTGMSNGYAASESVHVREGQAKQIDPTGARQTDIGVDQLGFVRPGEYDANVKAAGGSGYHRWLAHAYDLARDESLLAHFTFDGDAFEFLRGHRPVLRDANVSLQNLSFRQGRFREGSALSFIQTQSSGAFHLPGEYPAVTMAGWFRIERLDHNLVALMMSDGFSRSGAIHWQLVRTGEMRLSQKTTDGEFNIQTKRNVVRGRLGQWIHLACVVNVPENEVQFYVNGQMTESVKIEGTGLLENVNIGAASLGFWQDPDPQYGVLLRTLAGEIDEFLMFKRAFDPDEIEAMFEAGRPN